MRKTLALAVLASLTLAGCGDTPTSATRIDSQTLTAQRMQAPTRNTATLGPALGAGSATNNEAISGWFVRIVFRLEADGSQIEVANTSQDAAPGATVNLGVGVAQDPCASYQDDIFWMLPRAAHYTLSDTMNYPPVASRVGPFPLSVPVGVYRITAVTYDPHSVKQDGPQPGEMGNFVFNNGWQLGPTDDIADTADYAVTDFGAFVTILVVASLALVLGLVLIANYCIRQMDK